MLDRLKKLWQLTSEEQKEVVTTVNFAEDATEPFLIFPCEKCKEQITLEHRLNPGQVAVLKCQNCDESWAIYAPTLLIKPMDEAEDVWPLISNDPFKDETQNAPQTN